MPSSAVPPKSILHDDRRFAFIHVPKTAGTSLISTLASLVPHQDMLWTLDLRRLAPQVIGSKKYILGHITFSDVVEFVREPVYIATFFRDPVDRFLSWIDYCRAQPTEADDRFMSADVRTAKALRLRDFLSKDNLPLLKFWGNRYAVHLATRQDDPTLWLFEDPATLARAHENLQRLDFVGLCESYEQCLGELLDDIGLRPPALPKTRENATGRALVWSPADHDANRSDDDRVDGDLVLGLKQALAWDYELYQTAHERFMARHPRGYEFALTTGPSCRRLRLGADEKYVNNPQVDDFVVYGPYVTLPHGSYSVEFDYRVNPPYGSLLEQLSFAQLTFDVVTAGGTTVFAANTVDASNVAHGADLTQTLRFSLEGPVCNIEFRCRATGGVATELRPRVHVKRLSF